MPIVSDGMPTLARSMSMFLSNKVTGVKIPIAAFIQISKPLHVILEYCLLNKHL